MTTINDLGRVQFKNILKVNNRLYVNKHLCFKTTDHWRLTFLQTITCYSDATYNKSLRSKYPKTLNLY